MKRLKKVLIILGLSFILSGCNRKVSKDYIKLYGGKIYCSETDLYVDTDTQIGINITPFYINNGQEVVMVSKSVNSETGNYDFYKLCFMNTETYEIYEMDVKEYLSCSKYTDIEFNDNMKILQPGAIEYQNDVLYFTAKVNKNESMLFIIDMESGETKHSKSVNFFGSKIIEVSEDGKFVFVTVPKEQNIELKDGNVYNILKLDTESMEFDTYKEGVHDLQFSPDYKYMAYLEDEIVIKTNEDGEYWDSGDTKLVVEDMLSGEVVYELNPMPQSSKLYKFSADSKGILCFETQYRSVITGSQGRYTGVYIDLSEGTKEKLFAGKWGEELGEIIIIGDKNSVSIEIMETTTDAVETESSTEVHTSQSMDSASFIINKEFADLISKNNSIDDIYYAAERPYDTEGCIKMACTFRDYWWEEMDYSYQQLYAVLDSEDRQALEKSQEAWEKEFYNKDMVQKNLYYNNKYSVQGSMERVLLNDLQMENVRYRTIKLKEYYFIVTGELNFQFEDDENDEDIQSCSSTYYVPTPVIEAADIENNSIDTAFYSMKAGNMNEHIELLDTFRDYWWEEMDYSYQQLYAVLDSEDRQALEKSQEAWETDFYNGDILQNNLYVSNKYSESNSDNEVDLNNLQMETVRCRALELKEYYYIITGESNFQYEDNYGK